MSQTEEARRKELIDRILESTAVLEESLNVPKTEAQKIISNIDLLIHRKYMLFDTGRYHVAMLDNLWSMYENEALNTFCRNMLFYCDIMNAYNEKKVLRDQPLLISLKDKKENVTPQFTFNRNGELYELKKTL